MTPKIPAFLAAGLAAIVTVSVAPAQPHQPGMHHGAPAAPAAKPSLDEPSAEAAPADARQLVAFPTALRDHTLANMRDHLVALEEIQQAMAAERFDDAARIAEARLGMSSLGLHGAHEVAKFMPQGMQEAGTGMHRAASRFTIAVKDAGVTGDLKPAVAALAAVTAQCNGCHAGYRLK